MKKQKIAAIILAMLLAASAVACGSNDEAADLTDDVEVAETELETTTENETLEEQPEEADSEAFDIVTYADGTCMIKDCNSEESIIEVPETIEQDGKTYTVTEIGDMAFFQSTARRIILPDSVETIENMAFAQSDYLQEIVFGSGLKTVGTRVFDDCTALETVTFPEGMETLGYNFFGCESLGEVYIPESATNFPDDVIAVPGQAPNLKIITPSGSAAEAQAIADGFPVENA